MPSAVGMLQILLAATATAAVGVLKQSESVGASLGAKGTVALVEQGLGLDLSSCPVSCLTNQIGSAEAVLILAIEQAAESAPTTAQQIA